MLYGPPHPTSDSPLVPQFILSEPSWVQKSVCQSNSSAVKSHGSFAEELKSPAAKLKYNTAKTITQPKRTNCSKSAAGILPGSHQADTMRMHSHRLLGLDDNKAVAS